LERVDDVERRHEIEGAARKRRGGDARARQPRPSRAAPEAQSGFLEVEAVGAAEALKQIDVGAGPAPAVDDAQVGAAGDRGADERRDEGSETPEPEVTGFGARRRAQQVLHRGRLYRYALYRPITGSIDSLYTNSVSSLA